MTMARMNGERLLVHSRKLEMPLPMPMPNGPKMNAVSGIMMSREKNGTKTMCTAEGMIFFRPFSTQYRPTAAMSGGKTCEE